MKTIDPNVPFFRLAELQSQERRNRQYFESQLNQEKKLRKQADDKANIARCSETCKMKKMQQESENNKLRRELNLMEETKQNLEKQNRMYEHEVSVTASARCQKIIFCNFL